MTVDRHLTTEEVALFVSGAAAALAGAYLASGGILG